jgi:hypothetical protein
MNMPGASGAAGLMDATSNSAFVWAITLPFKVLKHANYLPVKSSHICIPPAPALSINRTAAAAEPGLRTTLQIAYRSSLALEWRAATARPLPRPSIS